MNHIRTEHGYFSQKTKADYIELEIQQGKSWFYDKIRKNKSIMSETGVLESGSGTIGAWSVSIDSEADLLHVEVKDANANMLFVLTDKIEEIQENPAYANTRR